MFEFKIPKDEGIMRALAAYLLVKAGGAPSELQPGPAAGFHFSTVEALDEHVKKRAAELGFGVQVNGEVIFPNSEALEEYVAERAGELGLKSPCNCSCVSDAGGGQAEEIEKGPTPPAIDTPAVELAGDPAIPWDARIHSGTKSKYAKAPYGWKLKRSVDPALVATVETELLGALAASPANPVTTEPDAETVFGTDTGPTPPTTEGVAELVAPTNFVELNLAITNTGIPTEKVEDAIKAAGLANYMLLPTRPDLIPFVAGQLGLGPVIAAPAS